MGAIAVAVLAAGCGGGSGGGSGGGTSGSAAGPAGAAQAGGGAAKAEQGGAPKPAQDGGGSPSGLPPGQLIVHAARADRSIVYTADVSVQTPDVAGQAQRAIGIAERAGGYIFGEQTGTGPRASTDLTLKVPAARFADVLVKVQQLGTRPSSTVNADDVTGEVVDLTSRVATAKASVARVRALLAQATSIGEVVDIEGELTQRESTLESLEGKLRVLQDQVALSTIDLHLSPPPPTPAPAPRPHHHASGFVGGLHRGWDAFLAAFTVCVTVLGAVLPFALLLGLAGAVGWWLWRRLRTGHAAAAPEG